MLNLDNYRSSDEYREILRILQKSTSLVENFVWQSHALSKSIIPIEHLEIDFVSRGLIITYDQSRFKVDSTLSLYVKLDYRHSVFKIDEFRMSKNTLVFSFPASMKTLELRQCPRSSFIPNQQKVVGLKSAANHQFHKDSGSELNVRVMDVSEHGFGLVVSDQNRYFLKNNRILWVTTLQGHALASPLLAEVVYMNSEVEPKFQIKKQKSLKVGLKLSNSIPADTYRLFLQ